MELIPEEICNFYLLLEQINTFDKWEFIKQVNALSEIYTDYWKDALITERIALQFILTDGHLKPIYSGISEDGKEVGFPLISDFAKDAHLYLNERAQSTKNQILIARYNHILFELNKNQQYSAKAVNAYKKLINLKIKNKNNERIIEFVRAILKLTEKSKLEIKKTKKELLKLVQGEELSVYDRFYIAKDLLDSKIFKSYELNFLPELSLSWIKQARERDYFFIKNILETAITVCINNNIDTVQYYEKLAENEDILLEEHSDEKDFLRPKIFANKMEYYKKAKNNSKYETANKEYSKAKSQVELNEVSIPFDDEFTRQIDNEIEENVKIMMKWDSNSILYYFTNDSPLFPDIQKTLKTATEAYNSSFLSAIATTQFDINANTKTLSEQESIDNEVYKTYLMSFGLSVLPTFVRVISNGVINGKLSYNHVYNFLLQYSWYGQKFPKMKMRINSKNDIDYNWLSVLAPALHNFLTQIETSILLKSYTRFSNWILCIDSLTLKFEGALRDFIRLTGTSTSKIKDEETREMLLEDLLNSSAAKELFTENDLALFKFVFTKKGDNIRNNVAHCFYHSDDYSFDKICRIFICILRLGKYRLKPSNDKNE